VIPLSVAEIAAITGGELSLSPDAALARGPLVTGPVVTGPVVTGPVVTGPVVTGPVVTGPVVIDSRQVTPGALFAALAGERVDGHDYAAAAA
jgi:UDP-N-acetylmuramyl pentapeptide synthase